jgi:hypothetical protein
MAATTALVQADQTQDEDYILFFYGWHVRSSGRLTAPRYRTRRSIRASCAPENDAHGSFARGHHANFDLNAKDRAMVRPILRTMPGRKGPHCVVVIVIVLRDRRKQCCGRAILMLQTVALMITHAVTAGAA